MKVISPELLQRYIDAQSSPITKAKIRIGRQYLYIREKQKLIEELSLVPSVIAESRIHQLHEDIKTHKKLMVEAKKTYKSLSGKEYNPDEGGN